MFSLKLPLNDVLQSCLVYVSNGNLDQNKELIKPLSLTVNLFSVILHKTTKKKRVNPISLVA